LGKGTFFRRDNHVKTSEKGLDNLAEGGDSLHDPDDRKKAGSGDTGRVF